MMVVLTHLLAFVWGVAAGMLFCALHDLREAGKTLKEQLETLRAMRALRQTTEKLLETL